MAIKWLTEKLMTKKEIEVWEEYPEIYHYTDIKGLLGILNDEHLWATHYRCLNDQNELNYGYELMIKKAQEDLKKKNPALGEEQINAAYEIWLKVHDDDFYVSSFCGHHSNQEYIKEHGLLSMWRGYGENGGFAVVLKTEEFEKFLEEYKKCNKTEKPSFTIFNKVKYIPGNDYKKVPEYFEKEFKDVLEIRDLVVKSLKSENEEKFHDYIKSFVTLLCCLKHYGFHEEQEVRIVIVNTLLNSTGKVLEVDKTPLPVEFRGNKTGLLVPYIKFPLNNKLIERIIVGPGRNQQNNIKCIEKMCKNKKTLKKIDVTSSDIPFIQQ